ncbi:MAG: glycoside hydrolase family 127 protein, partial [Bacteroidaceae bacterium]|nr:glycoside hydrolase family 127 protein [Bacteroidaceae bacterium]
HNGQKAYEMMSCYIGMLELFRETGDSLLLQSAEKAYRHIVEEEINICGSGASYECWYGGKAQQHRVAMHTMETCVTFTWMQFCERLLEFTGNPDFADKIERTLYNALLASLRADGTQIVKYTPLEGYRQEGEHQCGLPINCCNANGTRAFAMIPRIQYRLPEANRIDVNLYIPSTAQVQMSGNRITLVQETDYPYQDSICITINPTHQQAFTLALRIPAWSQQNSIEVNGEPVQDVKSGSYQLIKRKWKAGDRITLRIGLVARLVKQGDMQAIERGPIVLARDSRFGDGDIDENCIIPTDEAGIVPLVPYPSPHDGMWMAFRLKVLRGAYAEGEGDKEHTAFCDFASAGSTWDKAQRYRVWLPRTLNARFDPFNP